MPLLASHLNHFLQYSHAHYPSTFFWFSIFLLLYHSLPLLYYTSTIYSHTFSSPGCFHPSFHLPLPSQDILIHHFIRIFPPFFLQTSIPAKGRDCWFSPAPCQQGFGVLFGSLVIISSVIFF